LIPRQTETTQHVDKGHYGEKLAKKLKAADPEFSSGRQKTNISRSQAEESYQRALEEVNIHLEKVEKEVALATKTKWEIKEAVKDLGRTSLKRTSYLAKRSPQTLSIKDCERSNSNSNYSTQKTKNCTNSNGNSWNRSKK